jgi:hypothetical protein
MSWATFWAMFSQALPVTLFVAASSDTIFQNCAFQRTVNGLTKLSEEIRGQKIFASL